MVHTNMPVYAMYGRTFSLSNPSTAARPLARRKRQKRVQTANCIVAMKDAILEGAAEHPEARGGRLGSVAAVRRGGSERAKVLTVVVGRDVGI